MSNQIGYMLRDKTTGKFWGKKAGSDEYDPIHALQLNFPLSKEFCQDNNVENVKFVISWDE